MTRQRHASIVGTLLSAVLCSAAVAASPPLVRVVQPKLVMPDKVLTVPSNLMVDREIVVTTRVSGVIESIDVARGAFVRKGGRLASLDQQEFRLDLRAAEETFRLRQAEYNRTRELNEQKLTSSSELDQRKAAYELSRVELERARLVMNRSVIRAPIDGLVIEQSARVGQKVLVDEREPLFKISALEPLLARAYLPEAMLGKIRVGQPVVVASQEFPDFLTTGRVTFLSPVMEAGSGSFQIIVTMSNDRQGRLRPGMGVRIAFPDGHPTLILPASCLLPGSTSAKSGQVFVLDSGVLRKKTVEFSRVDGATIAVRSGISHSSWIVDQPSAELRSGSPIRVNR